MKLYSAIALLLLLFLFACSPCDIDQPDTAANRKGFEAHLGFQPTGEVTEVYFYADEWGGDAKYLLAFKAPQNVVDSIVKQQELKRESNQDYDSDSEKFPWWSSEFRRQAEFYQFEDERREILRQLWHDPATGRCHFRLVYW